MIGIVGSGKTILSSVVINDLHKRFSDQANIGVAYYYCDSEDDQEYSGYSVLRTAIGQLLLQSKSVPQNLRFLYKIWARHKIDPSDAQIMEAFQDIANFFKSAYIVVDGVDQHPRRLRYLT